MFFAFYKNNRKKNPRLLEQAGKLFWLFPKNQTLEREADS